MTDKKYTDEEIIKSLEYCNADISKCYECVLLKDCEANPFYSPVAKYALDLINRQKDEIERLEEEVSNTRRKALLEASSKFAGHSNYHGDTILCKLICMAEGQEVGIAIPFDISETKAEAYKEFANQIKMHKRRMRGFDLCYEFWDYAVSVEDVDNILKTMVGEEE